MRLVNVGTSESYVVLNQNLHRKRGPAQRVVVRVRSQAGNDGTVISTQGQASSEAGVERRTVLSVKGLKTEECKQLIKTALEEVPGVLSVDVQVEDNVATVDSLANTPVATLVDKIRALGSGYRPFPYRLNKWTWRGHRVNYAEAGAGPAVVLVHGFGASVGHYRKLAAELSANHRVLALDFLGFGASEKPTTETYDPHLWKQQLLDFVREVVGEPCVLVGNSIGSQVCLYAASEASSGIIGVCLLNCSGGMNQKGLYQDGLQLQLLRPVFGILELMLKTPPIARRLFGSFSSRERVAAVLRYAEAPVYINESAVDDELLDILMEPAQDEGALEVFVGVFTGDPGPRPESLVGRVSCPILVAWGDSDPWTPVDGIVARFFQDLAAQREDVEFFVLPNTGHCPQDDRPDEVMKVLGPWLDKVCSAT